MELIDLTLKKLRDGINAGKISAVDAVKATLKQIEKQRNLNALISVIDYETALKTAVAADERAKNGEFLPLNGVPIVVKDNICTTDFPTTCASKILKNYHSPYDATVVKRLRDSGAIIVGKANMDEFAMGARSENSAYGAVKNAVNPDMVAGGSSGGSSSSVAGKLCYGSLGTDTGGSIRQPASYCGVVGLKPTYSAVSRFGLIAYASSLDQIGTITRTVDDNALLFSVIAGYDPYDSTSAKINEDYTKYITGVKGKKIGVVKQYESETIDAEVKKVTDECLRLYEKLGATIVEVQLPSYSASLATYAVLSCAEAATNLARFDGIKYGYSAKTSELESLYIKSRTQGFGMEVKRRIMFGNLTLTRNDGEIFIKAQKVRKALIDEMQLAMEKCDFIVSPTAPTPAFRLGKVNGSKYETSHTDIFAVPANLTGNPAISIPCGKSGSCLPIGLQIIGKHHAEKEIFGVAKTLEREICYE